MKDLDSSWEPGDRSLKWLKLKPDYIQSSSDLDFLIIGGYYGSGRRGGKVNTLLYSSSFCETLCVWRSLTRTSVEVLYLISGLR